MRTDNADTGALMILARMGRGASDSNERME